MDNEWLHSIYNARHHWVPVYLRVSLNAGTECLNIFFDGHVNASTTLQLLVRQYEKAVSTWYERELKADFETTNSSPLLKTPSPMEKQATSLYTRKIFMKFQDELVETMANPATKIDDAGTITTYRIAECSVKAAGIGAAQAFLTSRLQHRPISPHDTMNNQPTLYSTSESNRRATFSDLPSTPPPFASPTISILKSPWVCTSVSVSFPCC